MNRGVVNFARLAVAAVFFLNMQCALRFVFAPGDYAAGFELSGLSGSAAVQGIGIAFLMWNATYPPVIWDPVKNRSIFGVVLVQQAIGIIGETWVLSTIPGGHEVLSASLVRFIVFDAVGLVAMAVAYIALAIVVRRGAAGDADMKV